LQTVWIDDDDFESAIVERFHARAIYQSVCRHPNKLNDFTPTSHFEKSFLTQDAVAPVEIINNTFPVANGQLGARSTNTYVQASSV